MASWCAAIFGESDVRVPEQIVLPVHDRTFPAHKQQRLVIGKQAHFVGGHQVAGRLLVAGTAASAASSGKASTGGFHCFLADQLGHILVGALLIAAQVEKLIAQTYQRFPAILVHGLQLGNVLHNDGAEDTAGTHGRQC